MSVTACSIYWPDLFSNDDRNSLRVPFADFSSKFLVHRYCTWDLQLFTAR